MNNIKKKGFTLVELVIVIAVVAILAAVLIPTFSGIITKAEISADKQEVVIINKHLAMADKISNSDDLYKIIEEYNKEVLVNNFAPKSAKQGNHYWFDVQNKTVVLKTYEDILNQNKKRVTTRNTNTFSEAEANSLRMYGGYFLLDNTNSIVAESISLIENMQNINEFKNILNDLNNISADDKDKKIAENLIEKITKNLLVTKNITVLYDDSQIIENIYYTTGAKTICVPQNINGELINKIKVNVGKEFVLSKEITTVESGALFFDSDTVKLYVDSDKEIKEMFKANSTNATICQSAKNYIVNDNYLIDKESGNKTELNYSNPVTELTIQAKEKDNRVVYTNNKLYIAYDEKDIQLIAKTNSNASSSKITWTSSNEDLIRVDEFGVVNIVNLPTHSASAEYEAVITACALNGGVEANIAIYVVRPVSVTISINNNTLVSPLDQATIRYNGEITKYEISEIAVTYNQPGIITCYDQLVVETYGDLFSIQDNILILNKEREEGLSGTQSIVVKYGKLENVYTVTITDESASEFEVKNPYYGDFLIRLGNENDIMLSSLFTNEKPGEEISLKIYDALKKNDNQEQEIANSEDGFYATYTKKLTSNTWENSKIRFYGTGVAIMEISSSKGAKRLAVEVINGKNVTKYSELDSDGNNVLLNDISLPENGAFSLTNGTLFGNGYTFDVSNGTVEGKYDSSNGLVVLNNASIDTVKITGAVYKSYGIQATDKWNRSTVLLSGNCEVNNCYITNSAAPIRMKDGKSTITNTTLKGGSFANLVLRNGDLTLEDVTTINQANLNDRASDGSIVVGVGIVSYYENVSPTSTITIKGELKQYNNVCQNDINDIDVELAKQLLNSVFSKLKTNYGFTLDGTEWVNTGLISMSEDFTRENIISNEMTTQGYSYQIVSYTYLITKYQGGIFTSKPNKEDIVMTNYEWKPNVNLLSTKPEYSFNYAKNEVAQSQDKLNYYCYWDNDLKKYVISFDEGDTFNWDTNILTVNKMSTNITYNVSMNNTTYTGQSINFDEAGDYYVNFYYEDPYNYAVSNSGADVVKLSSKTYTLTVHIAVSEVAPEAKDAEFIYANGEKTKIEKVGTENYIMPDVTGTSSKIGSIVVSGKTIYYPIVEIIMSDGKTSHSSGWYAYFPVFKNVISLKDYADGGTGEEITYNDTTTSMPTKLIVDNPTDNFKYQSSSKAFAEAKFIADHGLVYSSAKIEAKRDEYNTKIEYTYTDNKGTTYHYYVGYHAPAQSYSSTCIIDGTLITLANGSQVPVEQLKGNEQLLVLNHKTGKLDVANIAYIVDHNKEKAQRDVVSLIFSDGTELNMVGEHVFFDKTLNKYIAITSENYNDYINHTFVKYDGNNTVTQVKLIDVVQKTIFTGIYEVVTYEHMTCFTEGILSASAYIDKLLNIFTFEENTMKYDEQKMNFDIEKYGLFMYEDFEGMIPVEAFNLYNAKYLKVAIEKGQLTWDDIYALINIYFDVEVEPLV